MAKVVVVSGTAGLCAALASVCAKVAFSPDVEAGAVRYCGLVRPPAECEELRVYLGWLIRAAAVGGMVFSNGTMLTCFTKAMHLSSSLTATVAVTSFNFTCTAIMSMLFFGETLSTLWWAGFALILLGLAVLTYGQHKAQQHKDSKKQD